MYVWLSAHVLLEYFIIYVLFIKISLVKDQKKNVETIFRRRWKLFIHQNILLSQFLLYFFPISSESTNTQWYIYSHRRDYCFSQRNVYVQIQTKKRKETTSTQHIQRRACRDALGLKRIHTQINADHIFVFLVSWLFSLLLSKTADLSRKNLSFRCIFMQVPTSWKQNQLKNES